MSNLMQLYHLQQLDLELRQIKHRLEAIVQALKEPAELVDLGKESEAAEAEWKSWQKKQRDLDTTLQDVNRQIKAAEAQLYAGTLKNPKEMTDLQHKIEATKRQQTHLEDELLETMLMVEENTNHYQHLKQKFADMRQTWQNGLGDLTTEAALLTNKQKQLRQQLQELVAVLPPQWLSEYQFISKKQRNGVAMAALKGSVCQGCQVNVPAHTAKLAQTGQLSYCPSCGRILHTL